MHRTSRPLAIAALAVVAWTQPAVAGPTLSPSVRHCLAELSADYLTARERFQSALRDLAVAGLDPREQRQLVAVADLNRDVQIALARRRHGQIRYLLAHDPGRLNTQEGMSRFTNFDWSTDDDARAAAADPELAALMQRADALLAINNGHPGWPALREHFRTTVAPRADYAATMADLRQAITDLEGALGNCFGR